MIVAKQFADLITATRGLIAFFLIWLGSHSGAEGLSLAVWLMLADWIGDAIDGPISRRSSVKYHTWIGDHDLEIDMAVSIGLLVYLVTSGFVNGWAAGLYILFWTFVIWRWGNIRVLGMLSQAPIYGYFTWVALTQLPNAGIWIIVWMVVAIIITWPQFPQQVVPGFLQGIREFINNRREIR